MQHIKWEQQGENNYTLKMGDYKLVVNTTNGLVFWWGIQVDDEVISSSYQNGEKPTSLDQAKQQCLKEYEDLIVYGG